MRDAEIVKSSSGITSRHRPVRVYQAISAWSDMRAHDPYSSRCCTEVLRRYRCAYTGSIRCIVWSTFCRPIISPPRVNRSVGREAFFLVHHATPLSAQEYFRKKAPDWGSMAPCHVICFFVLNSKAASRDRAVVPLRHGTIGSLSL